MSQFLDALGNDKPDFDEGWQAQAYAMGQVLIESGKVDAATWGKVLGAHIRRRLADGAADNLENYFESVTATVETVLNVPSDELTALIEAWRTAYLETPHGNPVRLKPDA